MGPEEIAGDGVLLVPVPPERVAAVLAGELDGRHAGRGWPHADTPPALSFAQQGGLTWLVVQDGAVVGELGTKARPDEAGTVEIGYGLAGPSRGQGLGGRAVTALRDWLLAQDEVRRVIAYVDPANEPSIRLLRRLGFTRVGAHGGEERYELEAGPP